MQCSKELRQPLRFFDTLQSRHDDGRFAAWCCAEAHERRLRQARLRMCRIGAETEEVKTSEGEKPGEERALESG
jgi:hypothetical protein